MAARNRREELLRRLGKLFAPVAALPPEIRRAMDLLAAVDAGGVPLYPARVNQIARSLGLEVSSKAPVEETLARIRAAVVRHGRGGA